MLTKIWQFIVTAVLNWLARLAKSLYEQAQRNKAAQDATKKNSEKLEKVLAKEGVTDDEIKDSSLDLLNGNRN
jgi:hypothetical protein